VQNFGTPKGTVTMNLQKLCRGFSTTWSSKPMFDSLEIHQLDFGFRLCIFQINILVLDSTSLFIFCSISLLICVWFLCSSLWDQRSSPVSRIYRLCTSSLQSKTSKW